MNMIKVQGLQKNIKGKAILKDISFEVAEGECVALIGPNGAGKTTLLDCLLGDKLVTSGQVSIQGLSVTSSQLDYIRGYLPQENVIVQKLKVKELIAFFQSIYPNPLSNQEIDQLLQFDQQQKEQFAEKLSGGQKRLFSFVLTLIVPFLFMWICKSERNRAIGRASVVPTFFGVNEPILFGAPIVLNPIFFIPFIFAPIANVWIFKFFVDTLNMNSFSANLPWVTPGPLGIVLGTNFQLLSFVLAALLVVVDVIIYYPFVKVYDEQILEEERSGKANDALKEKVAANFNTAKADAILEKAGVDEEAPAQNNISEETNVLVLCAGGGTSGLLANALNKAAAEYNVPVKAAAGGYGAHREMLPEFDLVILAPQVASNFEDMKAETDKLGIKLAKTEGAQYIKLTRDGKGALDFVQEQFNN